MIERERERFENYNLVLNVHVLIYDDASATLNQANKMMMMKEVFFTFLNKKKILNLPNILEHYYFCVCVCVCVYVKRYQMFIC